MTRFFSRIRTSEDGQATLELALVLPVLVLLVLGILDFGTAFNYKNDVTSLANTAARYAEVNTCTPCSTGQTIDKYVQSTADSSALANGSSSVTPVNVSFCFPSGSSGKPGDQLKVTASTTYSWLPMLGGVIGSPSTTLTSSVIVRVQAQYDGSVYTAPACT